MRLLALAALLLPLSASAQYSADIGFLQTGPGEPFLEISATGSDVLTPHVYATSRLSYARAQYAVFYDLAPGQTPPDDAQSFFTLSLLTGGQVDIGGVTFRAGAGAAYVQTTQQRGARDLNELGGVAEVGIHDVPVSPSVGFGLGAHVTATRSYTQVGGRLGVRVRL